MEASVEEIDDRLNGIDEWYFGVAVDGDDHL